MTNEEQKAVQSGAQVAEEQEHLESGLEMPKDVSIDELEPEEPEGGAVETELGELTLSMFAQGQSVRVRVGNAHNASEMYEGVFETADEANFALLEAEVLTAEQVPDASRLAGTGLVLHGVTAERLEEAGLKRHGGGTPYGGIPTKVQPSTTGNSTE